MHRRGLRVLQGVAWMRYHARYLPAAFLVVAVCVFHAAGSRGADNAGAAEAAEAAGAADAAGAQGPAPLPFTVAKRQDKLFFYPCADCHDYMDPNRKVRELEVTEGHPDVLKHGDGKMWCFSCHDPSNYGQLRDMLGKPIGFDQGYQACGGCHSDKFQDWTHGAHGKRAANWTGDRRIYSCVECHNPHSPAIPPRAPQPPPPIRAGLKPMPRDVTEAARNANRPVWEQTHEK